ncbi:MAG: hypothetical protein NUV77_25580 [Thermoguttaceae bacterium]|nr:hypothetical protein [Thermoguttaceae bacterium]
MHHGGQGRQGRVFREAVRPFDQGRPGHGRGNSPLRPHLPARHPAAEQQRGEPARLLRDGPQRAHRQGEPRGGHRRAVAAARLSRICRAGPAAWRPYRFVGHWQGFRDFGLGSIGNWGSHVLDMAQWALGKDEEGPVEILPPQGDAPLTFRYADGIEIRCPRTPGDSADTMVFGSRGQKRIFGGPKVPEKFDPTPLGPGDVRLYRPRNNDHNGNWLECMRTRKKTICNEEVAYRSGSLCMLIAIMDQLQRPLRYDPVRGEFPGDAEANRLLDTPKRSPWQVY